MGKDLHQLPDDLPVPRDDGAALHLARAACPSVSLSCTDGRRVNLRQLFSADPQEARATGGPSPRGIVLFFYPRTGLPGQPPSLGFHGETWESIPGARGCTPQSCAFRDLSQEFRALDVDVFGVSTNTTEHQREFKDRNHIPFDFLSDSELQLVRALNLPTFIFPVESGGPTTLIKRMAWYIGPAGDSTPRIVKVWYPVFPPDNNAETVLVWLKKRSTVSVRAIDAGHDLSRGDLQFLREELTKHWGGTQIWSLGRAYEADAIPAFIAEIMGERVGVITYDINPGGYQCEIVTVSCRRENTGAATLLMEAVENAARRAGCMRIYLTTTNDNTDAVRFYQTRGWTLCALHKDNVDEARKRKPQIPLFGNHHLAVRHEIELELWLE